MSVVLVETFLSKRHQRPLYFSRMTGIGPMTTPDLAEAQLFADEAEARAHPASFFALTFFEPQRAEAPE